MGERVLMQRGSEGRGRERGSLKVVKDEGKEWS